MEIRESIKSAAKYRGIGFEDLAERMGITRVALYSRLKDPKYSTLEEIAGILGCGVWELLPYEDGVVELSGEVGIRERVELMLRSRGMTMMSLAAKLGEKPRLVERWLGREYPPLDVLYRISWLLGVGVSEILGEK